MIAPEVITAFVALFVVIDPIGMAPMFVALTAGMPAALRRRIAVQAVAVASAILLIFALAGEALLAFLGISMAAFRIAGGILLFLTALDMLFERRSKRREDQAHVLAEDPSVFPLAMPLIAGPGAIATIILLTGEAAGDTLRFLTILGVLAAVLLAVLVLFLLSGGLERLLRPTGINVVTRLLGMLLAALSVQFVLDGLRESFGL